MSESNLYYIYIDTRIDGAIEQLVSYFQTGIFNQDQCISVYVKYYKDIEKKIIKEFSKFSLDFKFIKRYSDLNFENNKVVFYLFNAQSNCRVVTHRNVTHVFVTHGESHKISSIKPIIRIYDYIITSGQVGVDRYLKAGIFNEHDILENRVIKLGNTFIGQNYYHYAPESKTLLYAPTWEGGVPNENYSSIRANTIEILMRYIQYLNLEKVVIQPHPNLGHRDKKYLKLLHDLANELVKQGISVTIRMREIRLQDRLKRRLYQYQDIYKECSISYAITDISAMEIQLLIKKIPVTVFTIKDRYESLIIPKVIKSYYQNSMHFIDCDEPKKIFISKVESGYLSYIEDFQEESLSKVNWSERIRWLCCFVNQLREKKVNSLLTVY
ncbi:hypothetical protein [Acinetobacter sp.]|uniref:hypothetical protein n=1 Tax=Acinetobacter sp. TaxID=472 RepID=UPI002FDB4111